MTLHTGCLWVSVTLGRKYRLANVHQLTHTTTHIPLPYISFCNAILSCHKHSFSFIFGKHSCFQWFQLSQNCQQHITALIVTTNHSNESNYTASRIHHMSNMSFVCFQKRNNWRKKKKWGGGGGGGKQPAKHTLPCQTQMSEDLLLNCWQQELLQDLVIQSRWQRCCQHY